MIEQSLQRRVDPHKNVSTMLYQLKRLFDHWSFPPISNPSRVYKSLKAKRRLTSSWDRLAFDSAVFCSSSHTNDEKIPVEPLPLSHAMSLHDVYSSLGIHKPTSFSLNFPSAPSSLKRTRSDQLLRAVAPAIDAICDAASPGHGEEVKTLFARQYAPSPSPKTSVLSHPMTSAVLKQAAVSVGVQREAILSVVTPHFALKAINAALTLSHEQQLSERSFSASRKHAKLHGVGVVPVRVTFSRVSETLSAEALDNVFSKLTNLCKPMAYGTVSIATSDGGRAHDRERD